MAILYPRDFKHFPYGLRPTKPVRVSRKFARSVKQIRNKGARVNSDNIGDAMMIVDNMRMKTPRAFYAKQTEKTPRAFSAKQQKQPKKTRKNRK
jgi:hypothetical protein